MSSLTQPATPFRQATADGYSLGGFCWRHAQPDPQRPLVIINAATSVRCRYYSRFADYLFAQGCDVLTYDYRASVNPARLRCVASRHRGATGAVWISKRCWRMRPSVSPASQ